MSNEFDRWLPAILDEAAEQARVDSSGAVEVQHLLLAIATDHGTAARRVLAEAGLDTEAIRAALEREFEHSLNAVGVSATSYDVRASLAPKRSPRLGASAKLAMERGFGSVARKRDLRPTHLLLGILRAKVGTVPRALALAGVDQDDLMVRAQQALDTP